MIYPLRTIVVGIAELDGRDPLLGPAVQLAERTGAELHLVHAFELPDLMWDAYARMGYMTGEALQIYAHRVQTTLEARVAAITTSPRVHCTAVAGAAAPVIRAVAIQEEADLILVGATRRGAVARAVLGGTAQRVLRNAVAPVLVLRDTLPAYLGRVLLTTDLSPFSAGVHELGLDVLESLAGGGKPELRSLLVVGHPMPLPPPLRRELLEEAARGELDRFLGERRARSRPIQGVVRFGDPAREIVAEAAEWEADLLILGSHGRSAPQRWVLGSVAEAALRGSAGGVLVIPATVEQQRLLPVPLAGAAVSAAAAHAG